MKPSTRRFYLCNGLCVTPDRLSQYPKHHIMGELRAVLDEGHRVTALAIFDHSVATSEWRTIGLPPEKLLVIGDAREIQCSRCSRTVRWEIGKAAMTALVQRQATVQRANA